MEISFSYQIEHLVSGELSYWIPWSKEFKTLSIAETEFKIFLKSGQTSTADRERLRIVKIKRVVEESREVVG